MIERDQMKEYSDEQVAEFIKEYVERQCMSGTFPNFVLEASERLKKNTTTSQRNESKTNLINQHYSNMEKLENITKHLKEEIEKEKSSMEYFAEHQMYGQAAICQTRMDSYEKAIVIVNTLF